MIRPLLLVLGAPLVVLALALGLALQALTARDAATAAEARLARALSHPPAEPLQRGAALLTPGAGGLADAALQAQVRAAVQPSGAEVLQIESLPPEPSDSLTRLRLSLHLRGSEAQIMAALQALEAAEPLVRADQLDLRGDGQEAGAVEASFTLSAWGEAP